jgi:N-acetylneuraminic acid mutarotase
MQKEKFNSNSNQIQLNTNQVSPNNNPGSMNIPGNGIINNANTGISNQASNIFTLGGNVGGSQTNNQQQPSPTNLNSSGPSSNPWKSIPIQQSDPPGPRAAHSCEIIGRKIYLFGGWNGKKALNDLFIFNLETFKWSEPEVTGSKPGLRNNHATCTQGKYMYLHGGHNGDVWLDDLYIFDTTNFIWNKINVNGEVPLARACHTLSRVDRKLYMFGGYDGGKCYNDIEVFDTENKTWSTVKCEGTIPLARNAHTITVVNKSLFLFGGHSGNKHLKDLFIFDTESLIWSEPKFGGESPEGLRGHTATHLGNKIIIFGGYDGKGRSNELFVLNLDDMNWSHIYDNDKFPGSRQRHSSVTIDNKRILIFGGFDGTKWLNDLHILDVAQLMENIITKKSSSEFQADMKYLVNNPDFSDVIFRVENGKIVYAHKVIISIRSQYFKELFKQYNNSMVDNNEISHLGKNINFNPSVYPVNNTCEFNFEGISENVFLTILEFLYTGTFSNKIEYCEMIDLLTCANEFQLKELKSLCENCLIYGMETSNIVDVLIASYKHNLADLKSLAINFILSNFQEVSKQKSFYKLEAHPQLLMEVMMLSLGKIESD